MIFLNKSQQGWLQNIKFGFSQIIDGIVRIISCGMLCTKFPLESSRKGAEKHIKRLIEARKKKILETNYSE